MNAVLEIIAAGCEVSPFAIRAERPSDVAAREALLHASFGAGRFARTCQRLRDGRKPAEGLALAAVAERKLIGTVRLWHVSAGACLRWRSALSRSLRPIASSASAPH